MTEKGTPDWSKSPNGFLRHAAKLAKGTPRGIPAAPQNISEDMRRRGYKGEVMESDGVAPSKGAWTPGPWKISATAVYETIYDSEDRLIGFLSMMQPEESQANALLISKCPAMAELLRELVQGEWITSSRLTERAERLLSELEVKS